MFLEMMEVYPTDELARRYSEPNPPNERIRGVKNLSADFHTEHQGREPASGYGYINPSEGGQAVDRADLWAGPISGPVGRARKRFDGAHLSGDMPVDIVDEGPVGHSTRGVRRRHALSQMETIFPSGAEVTAAYLKGW